MKKGKGKGEKKKGRKERESKRKETKVRCSPAPNTFLVTALISLKMTCKFLYNRPNI